MKVALVRKLKLNLIKAVTGLSGIRARLVLFAINSLLKFASHLSTYIKESRKADETLNELKKVINDPNSSADDVRRAAPDFLK
jgi:hypothetical protein